MCTSGCGLHDDYAIKQLGKLTHVSFSNFKSCQQFHNSLFVMKTIKCSKFR